jgi:gliding motility-associated-like protein
VQLVVIWGNCSDTADGIAIVHPLPEPSFAAEPRTVSVITPLIQFNNASSGDETWLWDFGDETFSDEENPNHAYQDTGVYRIWLTAISDQGCRDSVDTEVTVTPYSTIYVPNAFTPGVDGVNDRFRAYAADITGFEMKIFNRWGQMVHYSTNIEMGWDGGPYGEGELCPIDVYTYVILFTDFRGRTQQIGGKVTVIR